MTQQLFEPVLVDDVNAKLAELTPGLPEGVEVKVFYDRGRLVERAVGTVSKALIEAIVLVLALPDGVMGLFLKRSSRQVPGG